MNHRSLLFPLLLCLLLPSCVQWNIGLRIRENGETHTGVDVFHPVDGQIHRAPGMGSCDDAYIRAPEVTYTRRTPLVEAQGWFWYTGDPWKKALHIRPTGREHWALASCEHSTPGSFQRKATPPAETSATPVEEADARRQALASSYGSLSHTEASTARRLAAAPFDYLIDPALTGVSTLAHAIPTACVGVVALPLFLIHPGWFNIK